MVDKRALTTVRLFQTMTKPNLVSIGAIELVYVGIDSNKGKLQCHDMIIKTASIQWYFISD